MKYYFILYFIILISCNSKKELNKNNDTTSISDSSINSPQRISDSIIERLDESIIIDSLEIMKYEIGNLNKSGALEVLNLLYEDGWRALSNKELIFFFQ